MQNLITNIITVTITENYGHKLLRRRPGLGALKEVHGAKPPEAHRLYNRKGDVFYHFGSAFNNMKFILSLFDNATTDYPDRPLADGRMLTLLNTLRNFNAERNNKIHV